MEQPIAQAPVAPPEPKKSSPLVLILVILLVFFLGAGGMYAWQNWSEINPFKSKQKACTLEAKICPDGSSVGRIPPNCEFAPCPSPQPSPTPSIPFDWKTFTNRSSGYSLKAPSDMSNIASEAHGGTTITTTIQSIDYKEDESLCRGGCSYPVVKGWSLKMVTQRDWKSGYDKEFFKISPPLKLPGILSEEERETDGTFILVTKRTRADMPDLGNNDYYADFAKNETWYRIIFTIDKNNQAVAKKIFDQILSTFKFLQ